MSSPIVTAAGVIIVHLRQPGANDPRTDPLYEFGSFGLTGCHRTNLLSNRAAAGYRLAFAQGGPLGFRLVMLTPPVEVRELANCHEAFWSPADMPLRYEAAPLLVDNEGRSDVAGLVKEIAGKQRNTWMTRFSSAFRSRKKPLSAELAAAVINAWDRAIRDPDRRAQAYHEALPRRPDIIEDRHAEYQKRLRAARGEPEMAKPKRPQARCRTRSC